MNANQIRCAYNEWANNWRTNKLAKKYDISYKLLIFTGMNKHRTVTLYTLCMRFLLQATY